METKQSDGKKRLSKLRELFMIFAGHYCMIASVQFCIAVICAIVPECRAHPISIYTLLTLGGVSMVICAFALCLDACVSLSSCFRTWRFSVPETVQASFDDDDIL